jgi:glycosyltransferase involved in cell wall biosynthesis
VLGWRALVARQRILSIGHSYTIALNRRLSHELSREGRDAFEVTCVAPRGYHADLGWAESAKEPDEPSELLRIPAYLTRVPHLFGYGLSLRKVLEEPWDIIHAWEEPYILSGFQLATWANPKARFVFWTMQNVAKRYPPPFSWFEHRVVERSDGWFYTGRSVYETHVRRSGYARRPSLHVPIGVDVGSFAPDAARGASIRRRLGWREDGPPVVGFVGRFVEQKGIALLLEALETQREPFRALFLGGGPLQGRIEAFGERFPDRVRIVRASHDEVPAYLNAMDLLCAPSQTTRRWREQFGRMLTEAMASGVAVIGSDSGEVPFVIGDAGVVVPEADVAAFRRAIEALLGDPVRRAELAERGRKRVLDHYQWSVVARKQLDFFSRLLDGPRR